MSSNYQMWLTHNAGSRKLRFPVLPESLKMTNGSKNKSVDIAGLGEIIIQQDRPAYGIEFSSFFPAKAFPGMQGKLVSPQKLKDKLLEFKNSEKPSEFLITGTTVSLFCTIEDFPYEERGGDVGTIYYSLKLKEYREISVRKVDLNGSANKAVLPSKSKTRTDNRVQPKTYTVVSGDSLWNIAKKLLGSGSRYDEIFNLNKDTIKNPSLIYPGQVLKLPK